MQAAGLEVQIAQQAYWPTPSVSMERVQTQLPDPSFAGSPQVLTFRLQQPVWTGGRLAAQSNKALANQGIEIARLAEIQQALAIYLASNGTPAMLAVSKSIVVTVGPA